MHEIKVSHDYAYEAESLWSLLADFSDIERWWPTGGEGVLKIEKVVLEGKGIGLIRHIYNEGFPHAISERLDYLDPDNKTYKLSMVNDIPAGIIEYQATGVIVRTDKGCRLDYSSVFSTDGGDPEVARGFLLAAYDLMFKGLEQALERECAA